MQPTNRVLSREGSRHKACLWHRNIDIFDEKVEKSHVSDPYRHLKTHLYLWPNVVAIF